MLATISATFSYQFLSYSLVFCAVILPKCPLKIVVLNLLYQVSFRLNYHTKVTYQAVLPYCIIKQSCNIITSYVSYGQSYQSYANVNYDSGVLNISNFVVSATLELIIYDCRVFATASETSQVGTKVSCPDSQLYGLVGWLRRQKDFL